MTHSGITHLIAPLDSNTNGFNSKMGTKGNAVETF
jgi:hypothetical protein